MSRWLTLPAAVVSALAVTGIVVSTSATPSVDVVETSGITAAYDADDVSSSLSAFVEESRGASPSSRTWGCVMIQIRGRTDKGCGPLTVTTDRVRGSASVSGVVPSEVFGADGQSLGASSISLNATSTGADPAPNPCEGHHVLIDPVQHVEIRAGVIRPATIGWELISRQLGAHLVASGQGRTGERAFFIDESGVIRPTASPSPGCPTPLGG